MTLTGHLNIIMTLIMTVGNNYYTDSLILTVKIF